MAGATAGATRIEIPAALASRFEENEDFLEGLGGLEFSSAAIPGGGLNRVG